MNYTVGIDSFTVAKSRCDCFHICKLKPSYPNVFLWCCLKCFVLDQLSFVRQMLPLSPWPSPPGLSQQVEVRVQVMHGLGRQVPLSVTWEAPEPGAAPQR